MTIRETKESKKYDVLEVSEIENIPGFLDMDIDEFSHVEMNGSEFYLYLQKDYPAWESYENYTDEEKETVKKEAFKLYGYTEDDLFLVFFRNDDWR